MTRTAGHGLSVADRLFHAVVMPMGTQLKRNAGSNGFAPDRGPRAAAYVRMSTDHQKYSTENQADAIRSYAAERGIQIVRTYADEGESGLSTDGRDAFKRLIDDVRERRADFDLILVYDVSRWGRFQDTDESAHYEFICKMAGVGLRYCVEQFENDGSLSATIIKSMKRAMAGEYSRELSAKVFAGQCRLVSLGFRQGGMAGYGLRRFLVDEHRQPKAELSIGQQKSIQTDRVVLVPGPPEEVETIRRMYRMFVEQSRTEREIAEALNHEGRTTNLGRPWTRGTVHQILTNEKYVGNNVYNRISFKLKKKRVVNAPETWVRADGAFSPIVDSVMFGRVQGIIQERYRRFSDDEMLGKLASTFKDVGWLSALVIDERDAMPSSSAYRNRFGSLLRAYELVGFLSARDYRYIETNRFLRSIYANAVADVVAGVERGGSMVGRNPETELLTINQEFTASIVIVRCCQTPGGRFRWKVRFDTGLRPDITIALRMDTDNKNILDYYLFPHLDMPTPKLSLAEHNAIMLDAYRFDSLLPFFALIGRTNIQVAA